MASMPFYDIDDTEFSNEFITYNKCANSNILNKLPRLNSFDMYIDLELIMLNCKHIIVTCCYRAPSLPISIFIDELESLLSRALRNRKNVFMLGDFKLDLLSQCSKSFLNVCFEL